MRAVVAQAGTDSTTIQVSWDPPEEGSPITAYALDLRTNLFLSPINLLVPGVSTALRVGGWTLGALCSAV